MAHYTVGDRVEVMGTEDGLVGTYHPACIKSFKGESYARVEFEILLEDSGRAPLQEVVHHCKLRPDPPYIPVGPTDGYGEVDAWIGDVW